MNTKWKRGQKAELARRCGISPTHLGDILAGRKQASASLARVIEDESAYIEGIRLSRTDVLYPLESNNPLVG